MKEVYSYYYGVKIKDTDVWTVIEVKTNLCYQPDEDDILNKATGWRYWKKNLSLETLEYLGSELFEALFVLEHLKEVSAQYIQPLYLAKYRLANLTNYSLKYSIGESNARYMFIWKHREQYLTRFIQRNVPTIEYDLDENRPS